MDFKEIREKYSLAFTLGAVVLLGVATWLLAANLGLVRSQPPTFAVSLYYYDLNTGKLFVAPDAAPPIAAPSGPIDGQPAGVRAYVFSCTDCADEASHFVAYIETLEPEFRATIPPEYLTPWYLSQTSFSLPGLDEAPKVRRPDDKAWVGRTTSEGEAVLVAGEDKCGGKTPAECMPTAKR